MENNEQEFQKGSVKPNPTRHNRNYSNNSSGKPDEVDEEETNFDSENNDLEINPGQLDGEEIDLDRTGPDTSHGKKENLLGQGGYGTSGTSGTNAGGKQGYQSGFGPAGSQNGSTGYNAGSPGVKSKV